MSFTDAEKLAIIKGMLALSSQLGKRRGLFYCVDMSPNLRGFKVNRLTENGIGPWRRVSWEQASRVVATGEIAWTETISGIGRGGNEEYERAVAHMEAQRARGRKTYKRTKAEQRQMERERKQRELSRMPPGRARAGGGGADGRVDGRKVPGTAGGRS